MSSVGHSKAGVCLFVRRRRRLTCKLLHLPGAARHCTQQFIAQAAAPTLIYAAHQVSRGWINEAPPEQQRRRRQRQSEMKTGGAAAGSVIVADGRGSLASGLSAICAASNLLRALAHFETISIRRNPRSLRRIAAVVTLAVVVVVLTCRRGGAKKGLQIKQQTSHRSR